MEPDDALLIEKLKRGETIVGEVLTQPVRTPVPILPPKDEADLSPSERLLFAKICSKCGDEFNTRFADRTLCRGCKDMAEREARYQLRPCLVCGKTFRPMGEWGAGHFCCSWECRQQQQRQKTWGRYEERRGAAEGFGVHISKVKKCATCKNYFPRYSAKQRYCSGRCWELAHGFPP